MSKPVKHGNAWGFGGGTRRARRRSAVFDDYRRAQAELSRGQVEVAEIKAGIRNAPRPTKTFDDLAEYRLEKRAPRRRSEGPKSHPQAPSTLLWWNRAPKSRTEDFDDFVNLKIDDEDDLTPKVDSDEWFTYEAACQAGRSWTRPSHAAMER
jgi:hypothetical protein